MDSAAYGLAHPEAIWATNATTMLNHRLGLLLAALQVIASGQLHAAFRTDEGVARAAEERQIRTAQQDGKARITVTGARITQGDAVNCPKIRTDDGQVYSVSHLAPSIAIGDRISVTGFLAHVTTCLGPVLYVEKVVRKD